MRLVGFSLSPNDTHDLRQRWPIHGLQATSLFNRTLPCGKRVYRGFRKLGEGETDCKQDTN